MNESALTRADVVSRIEANRIEIFDLGVNRLALFGSVQRNTARSDSDVDLLVEFRSGGKTFANLLSLADLLERALGHRVELVTTDSLSPHLGPRILAEARDVLRAA
jgi:uncharacterized protein